MMQGTTTSTEETPPTSFKTSLLDLILLIGGLSVILILFGYLRPLARPDGLTFLEITREMLQSHHWVTPTLNNVIQLDYPPLFYWLTALSFKLFGYTLFAARFWPAIFSLLGVTALYLFGAWFAGRRMAWLSALIAASSILYLTLSTAAAPYIMGSALITISLCSLFVAAFTGSERQRTWLGVLFWVSNAANCLLLGLAGVLLPILIALIYTAIMDYQINLKILISPKGIFVFLVMVLPWFFLVQKQNPAFLHFFFIQSIYLSYIKHFDQPLIKLLWVAIGAFIALSPWSILINIGYRACKPLSWVRRFEQPVGIFVLSWLMITAVYLIGVAPTGIGSFLWLALLTPGLSLSLGKGLDDWWDVVDAALFKASRGLLVIIMILLTASFFLISKHLSNVDIGFVASPGTGKLLWMTYALFLLGGIATYFSLKRTTGLRITTLILILTGFITTFAFIAALPKMRQDSIQPIADYITAHRQSGDVIAEYKQYFPALSFVLQKTPVVVIGWENMPTYGALYQNTQNWVVDLSFFWDTMKHNGRAVFFVVPTSSLLELQNIIAEYRLKPMVITRQAVLFTY